MEEFWYIRAKGENRRRGKKDICLYCKKEFIGAKNRKYCSQKCSSDNKLRRVAVKCANCGKDVFKKLSYLKIPKHGFYFCNRKCKEEAQRLGGNCPEIRPPHYGSKDNGWHVRTKLRNLINDVENSTCCCDCKNSKRYLLLAHHIDKDRNNNEEENFEIVCGNCHMKRHLKKVGDIWIYDSHFLTPREMLSKL